MGTSARNVILLGDPLQLAQVSQGVHPEGTRGVRARAPARRRRPRSRRTAASSSSAASGCIPMSAPSSRRSSTPAGSDRDESRRAAHDGLRAPASAICRSSTRAIATSPTRRSRGSRREIERMLGGAVHRHGRRDAPAAARRTSWSSRPTTPRCAASAPASRTGVRVGTVDKFQGQEAPIVFFSMATSSGRGRAPQPDLPLLPQPAQRGDLARAVPGPARLLAAPPGGALRLDRGDGAGQRAVSARRVRRTLDPLIKSAGQRVQVEHTDELSARQLELWPDAQ